MDFHCLGLLGLYRQKFWCSCVLRYLLFCQTPCLAQVLCSTISDVVREGDGGSMLRRRRAVLQAFARLLGLSGWGFYVKDSEHEFPEQKLDLYKLESKPVVLFQAASMCLSPEVAL